MQPRLCTPERRERGGGALGIIYLLGLVSKRRPHRPILFDRGQDRSILPCAHLSGHVRNCTGRGPRRALDEAVKLFGGRELVKSRHGRHVDCSTIGDRSRGLAPADFAAGAGPVLHPDFRAGDDRVMTGAKIEVNFSSSKIVRGAKLVAAPHGHRRNCPGRPDNRALVPS